MINNIQAQDLKDQFMVALVVSRFNQEITSALYQGAIERLQELNFHENQIITVWVPGAVEIPITAKRLAMTNKYEAIICLGAVIRGKTAHFDYVCQQVSYGCQKVALKHDLPVVFGVLTTDNEEQALQRIGGSHGHKGRDAVDVAFEMVSVLRQVQ